jgi:hypothetical protein
VASALMQRANASALTIDCIVRKDGSFRFFIDYGAPIRLSGDIAFTGRHLRYLDQDPLLALLASGGKVQ